MPNKFVHLAKFCSTALAFAISISIVGCGQKGPLKLPVEERAELPIVTNVEGALSTNTDDEPANEKSDIKETNVEESSDEK